MKLILITLSPLLIIAGHVCAVWAFVSFIIYIAKDQPFQWLSVWLSASAYALALLFGIMGVASTFGKRPKVKNSRFRNVLNNIK